MLGTLSDKKDQARNNNTTVQEKDDPVLRMEDMENVLVESPAATSHCVATVKNIRKRGGTMLYLTTSYMLMVTTSIHTDNTAHCLLTQLV